MLANELVGGWTWVEALPMWPCPNPEHAQTGRTPPVVVVGEQRWHRLACGNGGTAIDLVRQVRGVTAREAISELAQRVGVPPLPGPLPTIFGRPSKGRPS